MPSGDVSGFVDGSRFGSMYARLVLRSLMLTALDAGCDLELDRRLPVELVFEDVMDALGDAGVMDRLPERVAGAGFSVLDWRRSPRVLANDETYRSGPGAVIDTGDPASDEDCLWRVGVAAINDLREYAMADDASREPAADSPCGLILAHRDGLVARLLGENHVPDVPIVSPDHLEVGIEAGEWSPMVRRFIARCAMRDLVTRVAYSITDLWLNYVAAVDLSIIGGQTGMGRVAWQEFSWEHVPAGLMEDGSGNSATRPEVWADEALLFLNLDAQCAGYEPGWLGLAEADLAGAGDVAAAIQDRLPEGITGLGRFIIAWLHMRHAIQGTVLDGGAADDDGMGDWSWLDDEPTRLTVPLCLDPMNHEGDPGVSLDARNWGSEELRAQVRPVRDAYRQLLLHMPVRNHRPDAPYLLLRLMDLALEDYELDGNGAPILPGPLRGANGNTDPGDLWPDELENDGAYWCLFNDQDLTMLALIGPGMLDPATSEPLAEYREWGEPALAQANHTLTAAWFDKTTGRVTSAPGFDMPNYRAITSSLIYYGNSPSDAIAKRSKEWLTRVQYAHDIATILDEPFDPND